MGYPLQMTLRNRRERKQKLEPYSKRKKKGRKVKENEADHIELPVVAVHRVRFDFGPSELNCRNFVFKAWQKLVLKEFKSTLQPVKKSVQPVKNTIRPDDSFVIYHNQSANIEDICLDLFDSVPVEVPIAGEHNDDVIVCVIDDTVLENQKALNKLYENWNDRKVFTVMKTSKRVSRDHLVPFLKCDHLKRVIYGGNLSIFYEELYAKLESEIKMTKQDLKESKKECERRLDDLLALLSERKREGPCKLTKKCAKLLNSAVKDGIIGYRLTNSGLILYVNKNMKGKKQFEEKRKEIKCNFASKVRTCYVKIPFLRPHHAIPAGARICNKETDFCGTLGMFGNLSNSENAEAIMIAITSPHVLWKGSTATVDLGNNRVDLGKCVWPNKNCSADGINANLTEISVIVIDKNAFLTVKNFSDPVTLYKDPYSPLKLRPVFKYGATSNKTTGIIFDTEFNLFGTDVIVIIPDEEEEMFSQPGDSGAILLTKQGRKLFALGVIFGGDVGFRIADKTFPKNAIIAANLYDAIQRFNQSSVEGIISVENI